LAKRSFDILVAGAALILLGPVMLLVAAAIAICIGRPIFFRQVRPGLHGAPFAILKFRTMTDECDEQGRPLPDERRLTRLGRMLRITSVDELPTLWNVLRGDMSFVGPRPLLMEYLPLYSEEQRRRHEIRPGVTGWAQVNGRNAISWDEKFAFDLWYVDHASFALDLKILWLTARKVLKREGINHQGDAPMPYFTGRPESGSGTAGDTSSPSNASGRPDAR
jgi:lipopolysaccharide/colanic/teichoic acid biosynthesis glycosyltransferase